MTKNNILTKLGQFTLKPVSTLLIMSVLAFIIASSANNIPAETLSSEVANPSPVHDIRPLDDAYANGPPQLTDITATDAVLIFQSNVPLACSIVYGKTTEYGQLSLDTDMNGGAHTDHHPILSGLDPDTEYQYRLQGTAPDGTIYISENGTFRTLPDGEGADINQASLEEGASITAVSSNFGGAANDQAWGANNAIDGNRATAWSSNGDGNGAFIEITLPQPTQLTAIEVWTRSMGDGTAQILEFTLTTGNGEILGPFSLNDATQAYRFEIDAVASSLRLDIVDSTGGNTGLIEFAAYGTSLE
jgi:hypothetical protein